MTDRPQLWLAGPLGTWSPMPAGAPRETPGGPAAQLRPGARVLCDYRMPPPLQPWIHPVYVGVVEAPSAVKVRGMSDAEYCAAYGYTPVRYSWGLMLDKTANLAPTDAVADFYLPGGC